MRSRSPPEHESRSVEQPPDHARPSATRRQRNDRAHVLRISTAQELKQMAGIKFNCPHCRQPLEAPGEAAGAMLPCPNCGQDIQVPVPVAAAATSGGAKCGICLSPINEPEAKTACPACHAEYHAECWQENGGCAVYGCSQVPVVEKRQAIEIPMSYWGQENKQCPSCKREILAAAVRCRHCGATFESARPQDAEAFRQRNELSGRLPTVRRNVIVLFA